MISNGHGNPFWMAWLSWDLYDIGRESIWIRYRTIWYRYTKNRIDTMSNESRNRYDIEWESRSVQYRTNIEFDTYRQIKKRWIRYRTGVEIDTMSNECRVQYDIDKRKTESIQISNESRDRRHRTGLEIDTISNEHRVRYDIGRESNSIPYRTNIEVDTIDTRKIESIRLR